MPEMSEKSIAATPHIKLFFVLVAVQTLPIWIIADLGLLRNQIDKAVYKNFQFKPSLEIQKMCEWFVELVKLLIIEIYCTSHFPQI